MIPNQVPDGLDPRTLLEAPQRLAGCARAVADARSALDLQGFSDARWQRLRAALWAYNTTLAARPRRSREALRERRAQRRGGASIPSWVPPPPAPRPRRHA